MSASTASAARKPQLHPALAGLVLPVHGAVVDSGVTERGIVWATVVNPFGGANGYVHLPDGVIPDDCHGLPTAWHHATHGGVTFAADGWIGFDTCHTYDVWPEPAVAGGRLYRPRVPSLRASDPHWNRWTNEKLVAATVMLADAVAENPYARDGGDPASG